MGTSIIGNDLKEGGYTLFENTVLEMQKKSTKKQ
jgi:hypothetical protein